MSSALAQLVSQATYWSIQSGASTSVLSGRPWKNLDYLVPAFAKLKTSKKNKDDENNCIKCLKIKQRDFNIKGFTGKILNPASERHEFLKCLFLCDINWWNDEIQLYSSLFKSEGAGVWTYAWMRGKYRRGKSCNHLPWTLVWVVGVQAHSGNHMKQFSNIFWRVWYLIWIIELILQDLEVAFSIWPGISYW